MSTAALKRPLAATTITTDSTDYSKIKPLAKKIRLQSTTTVSGTAAHICSLLENVALLHNSKEILEALVQISDEMELDESQVPELYNVIKKLVELYRHEREGDSIVRAKILDVLADLTTVGVAEFVVEIITEILQILKSEKNQKVVAVGLKDLHKICKLNAANIPATHFSLIYLFASQNLISEYFGTQRCALLVMADFATTGETRNAGAVETIAHFADSADPRVRTQALRSIISLGELGAPLSPDFLYNRAIVAMQDDYDGVRLEALKLVFELGIKHPDFMIMTSKDKEQEMRLIDAAFSKVCGALCDLSIPIRTKAAYLLGSMTQVSSEFLHQTLDKKLMSNLRRKRTAHERGAQLVRSGEWSSGKRWADDTPQEELDAAGISLIASGSCGALVHGLEDEFLEVRAEAVKSMCKLALCHPEFAVTSLDFLVDMFNDEIENVRLEAIYSLTAIAPHIVLREDQLEIMLGALEDYSMEVREGLHIMLGACRVSTQACLLMVVQKLLDVLSKYPEDKISTFGCMRKIGQKHPYLCMALTSHLLQDHPFFVSTERDVEDPSYLCILILLFNAAEHLVPIISLFPEVTLKHYAYLRDAMPTLVPSLPVEGASTAKKIQQHDGKRSSHEYIEIILKHIDRIFTTGGDRETSLKTVQRNLQRLGEIEPEMTGTAEFYRSFLSAQIQIDQLQHNSESHGIHRQLKESFNQLIYICLKLQHFFSGLEYGDKLLVKQTCLRASAVHLALIVRDRAQSALGPCQMLMSVASDLSGFLNENEDIKPDEFTITLLTQLANVTDPKPGRVFRVILPLLQNPLHIRMPPANMNIRMCVATILEPSPEMCQDNTIKVTAGLIAALPFVAEMDHLLESKKEDVRIKIKYPDQSVQMVTPKLSNFKKILTEEGEHETKVRLRTTLLLSHSVWTESSWVEITLCLAHRINVELALCKPAKILFAPKPVRRGI